MTGTGEVLDFHCRPTLKGLVGQLEKVRGHFDPVQMRLWYQASYVGFSLQRDLTDHGYACEVAASAGQRQESTTPSGHPVIPTGL